MEFVTLPQIARDLNTTERRIRRRLRRLITAGKLVDGQDFSREDYQDEFHFTYMIDPQRFVREAKLQTEAEDALRERTQLPPKDDPVATRGEQNGSEQVPSGQQSDSQMASQLVPPDSGLVSKEVPTANKDDKILDFLMNELVEKNKELEQWRGLLPEYQKTVEQLIEAEKELRRLGPGPESESVINVPSPEPESELVEVGGQAREQEEVGTNEENEPNRKPLS